MATKRRLAQRTVALIVGLGAILGAAVVMGGQESTPPPCAAEDGSSGPIPCLWDGSTRGNGQGDTYVIR